MNLPAKLAQVETKLAAATAQRDAWLAKQVDLADEIANFQDWRLAGNGRDRDSEFERQRDVKRQLQRLHQGTLYCEPGRTYGQLAPLEARVELTQRRDQTQQQLDAHFKAAEALLTEPVST